MEPWVIVAIVFCVLFLAGTVFRFWVEYQKGEYLNRIAEQNAKAREEQPKADDPPTAHQRKRFRSWGDNPLSAHDVW